MQYTVIGGGESNLKVMRFEFYMHNHSTSQVSSAVTSSQQSRYTTIFGIYVHTS